jgi:hypothetical protein
MFLKSDFLAPCARMGLAASAGALAILLLGACSTRPHPTSVPAPAAPSALPAPLSAPASAPASGSAALLNPGPAAAPAAGALAPSSADTVARLLAYADRVRTLPSAELSQEIARLGSASAPAPAEQLQLALALSQLRQTPELIRAQELLSRVINSSVPEAQALQPLARLLAARYGEQRRLEDQIDRQAQQLREVQRRLDQTHERLEALKAIERSLTSRPPASAASTPASRPRRPAAPAP